MENMRKDTGPADLEKRLKKWMPIPADKSRQDTQGELNGF
jgi:hypothetical protein